ncbi:zinc phosphodiesterase ELAC protein 1 [Periophthalmus magnuspinnatus]|uniref:Metallo-beta-lactamase domain-containing protein n=1 Tax=Periophthalmus magnuspinnatus TaxID=409849 RepID=A0A3B4AMT3_9GOBI|nr:zinc phosphodiesterase ELAC protein 1 [Periophthalmus magnuspinnatus]
MSMDLTFLGTGSAYPSPHRGASALVLRTDGDCWLFDCGEGTQTQLMKSQLRAGRITKVFISHLHGDHVFGLPGLLCTVSLNMTSDPPQRPRCVDIFGPRGLRHLLRVTLGLTASQLLFPYAVHELEPTSDQSPEEGQLSREVTMEHGSLHPQEQVGRSIPLDPHSDTYLLFEDERFEVKAFRLYHRVPSFGFCVQERDRPGRLKTELLKELGVKPGPLYGRLKSGQSLTLDCGRVLTPEEVLEEDIPGRKVCVLGDCSSVLGSSSRQLCSAADILVHEATLGDEQREKAVEHGHSTPKMAAALAQECNVRKLVLYHFSQRYKPSTLQKEGEGDDICELKRQAEEALQGTGTEVVLAEDFLTLQILLKRTR